MRSKTVVLGATEAMNDDHGTIDEGSWAPWENAIAMYENPFVILVECFDRGCSVSAPALPTRLHETGEAIPATPIRKRPPRPHRQKIQPSGFQRLDAALVARPVGRAEIVLNLRSRGQCTKNG